jgi:succinate-semialdehyde dehydrogenase/glutarate-semialdehyde dehydrogenase
MSEHNGGLGEIATGMYIGGEWVERASDGAEIEVLDPATATPIATVPSGSMADAAAAVDAASDAADSWAATPPRMRSEILRRSFELIVERSDQLARLIVAEMGKAFSEAKAEAVYAAEFYRWFSEEAVRNLGSLSIAPNGDKRIVVEHQPIGVSLLITPWNFPAAMATRKIAPALAAGCTVILKPASDTPLTALALAGLMTEAGTPPGVINVLPSRRSSEVVPAMLADPRVRKVSFTGSTEVGAGLLADAAKHIVKSSMELGGNAPFLVFEDADMDASIEGAMIAKLRNGGQSCIAANRFYAHAAVADDFSARLSEAMKAVVVGPGMQPDVGLGPLINLRAQQDMEELVGVSAGAGATVAVGGRAPELPGFFWEPTVLSNVSPGNPILNHEIFGPVAPVVAFDTEEEAVALANDTVHGLAAYLYTEDLGRAMRVSEAIESGMIGVNRGLISDPAAPFGGMKESGVGREGAHIGMLEFTETKYIAVDW